MEIPALSLHQPYAQLIALGAKTIETRGRCFNYRGPIAIAATVQRPNAHQFFSLMGTAGFYEAAWCLPGQWDAIMAQPAHIPAADPLVPLGAVVAIAYLADCIPIRDYHPQLLEKQITIGVTGLLLDQADCLYQEVTDQQPYGDFRPGRWALMLEHVVPLPRPVPARGYQGLWKWTVPPLVRPLVPA